MTEWNRRQQVFSRTHLVVPQSAPPWCQHLACGKDRVIGGRQQLDLQITLARRAGARGIRKTWGSQNGDALAASCFLGWRRSARSVTAVVAGIDVD